MKNNTHVVYATTNPGKIIEIARHFGFYGIQVRSLRDFVDVNLDVEETGTTLGENAILKSKAYANVLAQSSDHRDKNFIVVSDDTGIKINGLNGEPGIKVRRWKGYKMEDEEIIEYTLERMKGLKGNQRDAQFGTVLAVTYVGPERNMSVETFEGTLDGSIREEAHVTRIAGFPFESLFQVKEWDMLLGDLHRLSDEEKRKGYFNHRERAIEQAVPYIQLFL